MADKYTELFVNNLYHQIDELESEVQIQCEEKQKLIDAGEKLKEFIQELINADLLYDETFDEANELIDDWNDLNK